MRRWKKGAHLWFRKARRDQRGNTITRGVWIIIDGGRHYPTLCFAGEDQSRTSPCTTQPPRKRRGIEQIDIADVLSIYVDAALAVFRSRHGAAEGYEDTVPAVRKFQGRIDRLNDFWGGRMLAEVTGDNCRQIRRHTAATWLMQNSASR